jgi:autotransporter strand-loop-strand O-heptosyltransferase
MVDTKEMRSIPTGFPGEYYEPDFEQFKSKMKLIAENWDECRQKALIGANFVKQQFSWDKAAEIAANHLKVIEQNYKPKEAVTTPSDVKIGVNFIDGCRFEITSDNPSSIEYNIKFIDNSTGHIQYQTKLRPTSASGMCWAAPSARFFINWKIEVNALASEEDSLTDDPDTLVIKGQKTTKTIFTQELNLKNQRVFINLDSKALGDNLAWIPYVEAFQQKWGCKIIISTFWNALFEQAYPNFEFVRPGTVAHNLYAQYKIGCNDNDTTRNKNNWREIPLQKVAADVLGLNYVELKPRVSVNETPVFGRKFVCISDHSTMQSKYWNYPGGWQEIIDYIGDLGYDVVALSKDPTGLKKLVPINNKDITETTSILNNCEFFIGVGSGLSWLSWALNKKVIMISGFSDPFTEFISDNYRLSPPPGKCHGCFNDVKCKFDRSWDWCPRGKDYECSKTITPEMVKEKIDLLIKHL